MIACVIVVHNIEGREEIVQMTEQCLNSFYETIRDRLEDILLVLVDNGSNDNERALKLLNNYRDRFTHWLITRNDYNLPIAECWNDALDDVKNYAMSNDIEPPDTIVLLNNDVVFNKPGWLTKLIEPLSDPSVGVSGSKMMTWYGFEFLEGAFLAFSAKIADSLSSGVDENGIPLVFDPRFNFTCEEVDFCHRSVLSGKRLVETKIEDLGYVTHLHHGTLSWSNHEGGWNGMSILDVMHESRKQLCRKYGKAEYVND